MPWVRMRYRPSGKDIATKRLSPGPRRFCATTWGVIWGPPRQYSTRDTFLAVGLGTKVSSTDWSKFTVKSIPQESQCASPVTPERSGLPCLDPLQWGQRTSQLKSSIPARVAWRKRSSVSRRSQAHASAIAYGRIFWTDRSSADDDVGAQALDQGHRLLGLVDELRGDASPASAGPFRGESRRPARDAAWPAVEGGLVVAPEDALRHPAHAEADRQGHDQGAEQVRGRDAHLVDDRRSPARLGAELAGLDHPRQGAPREPALDGEPDRLHPLELALLPFADDSQGGGACSLRSPGSGAGSPFAGARTSNGGKPQSRLNRSVLETSGQSASGVDLRSQAQR